VVLESDAVSCRAPALFILYVDDLVETLPQRFKHSFSADDLAIWSSSLDPLYTDDLAI